MVRLPHLPWTAPLSPALATTAGLTAVALAAAGLAAAGSARAQDLVGCQLVGASLQCIPGVDASPQQQIRQLQQEISSDLQLEGAVQQQIDGLSQLVLAGQASVGALLTATAVADAQAALPDADYHWYRLRPGQRTWVLIESARGTTYVPAPVDIGSQLMVVAVVNRNGMVQRIASQPLGPVR